MVRCRRLVPCSHFLLSSPRAPHCKIRVLSLPQICFCADSADAVPGLFRLAVRPLRLAPAARDCGPRQYCAASRCVAMVRHVALQFGAARCQAGDARRRLDADAAKPPPSERLPQRGRRQPNFYVQGSRARTRCHHGAPLWAEEVGRAIGRKCRGCSRRLCRCRRY